MTLISQAGRGTALTAALTAAVTAGAAFAVSPAPAAEAPGGPAALAAPVRAPLPAPSPGHPIPAEAAAGIASAAGPVVVAPGVRLPATAPDTHAVASPAPAAGDRAADGGWTTGVSSWFSKIARRLDPGAEGDGAVPPEAQEQPEAAATGAPAAAEGAPAQTGAGAPTLANARWLGFTPAIYTGSDDRPGAWIAGPFDRNERTGWIADTATGVTARVTLLWRDGAGNSASGGAAVLSHEAAQALGLRPGDVANVAVYLPR